MSLQQGEPLTPEKFPKLVKDYLVDQHGESQDRCVRGYFPSQSIKRVLDFLGPEQIQQIKGTREHVEGHDPIHVTGFDVPECIELRSPNKVELSLDYERSTMGDFPWDTIQDMLIDMNLKDIAISKLVFRMEHPDLRDHLFDLLKGAVRYDGSHDSTFLNPFYFVMESCGPEKPKDYDNIEDAHDQGYLAKLNWRPRTLDLMAIWSKKAWTKNGTEPYKGLTQYGVEELAFNQRKSDEPVFGAVNSLLVVNRWRTPFGSGMTDVRHYDWEDDQQGWVRAR